MASTIPNPTALRRVGDYMRLGTAYEWPLDAFAIERLTNVAGVLLGVGVPGGKLNPPGSTGATKAVLGNNPVSGLLNLIIKYSGGGPAGVTPNVAPIQQAVTLIEVGTAYQTPLDETIAKLIRQFAIQVQFPALAGDLLSSLRDAPYSTLIYLLYWVGTASPVNPYTSVA